MTTLRIAFCLLAAFLIVAPVDAAMIFTANMDDTQEVAPGTPGTTTGTATVTAQLRPVGVGVHSLTMQLLFTSDFNFSAFGGPDTGAEIVQNLHIHNAARGVSGPVVWGIFAPDHDVDNDSALVSNLDGTTIITSEWDFTEGNGAVTLADFLSPMLNAAAGEDVPLYLNLHTADAAGGSIRGQFVAVPEPSTALLAIAAFVAIAVASRCRRNGE